MGTALKFCLILLSSIVFLNLFASDASAANYCGTNGCFTYDSATGNSYCGGLTGPSTTTSDLTPCIEELGAYRNTCCQQGSCTGADGSALGIWDWNYASGCTASPRSDLTCFFKFQYQTQTCGATDSCLAQPYLNPGQCSNNGCTTGPTVYKTCCYSDGSVDASCRGGNFTGTCPSNTTTVICGVSSCAGISAPCTTAACGDPACIARFPPPPTQCEPLNCIYSQDVGGQVHCYSGHSGIPSCSTSDLSLCFNTSCSFVANCSGASSAEVACPFGPAPPPPSPDMVP